MHYNWDFNIVWEYRYALLAGLLLNIVISFVSILCGTILAIPLALGLISRRPLISRAVAAVVHVVRSIPLLVALIAAHYVIPMILGRGMAPIISVIGVFSINLSAFAADILRGGVLAIPREHLEAGMALGMTRVTVLRRVTLPETMRYSFPGLVSLYISLFKYSTLAAVISVKELLGTADLIIVERFRPLEIYAAVACLYICCSVPLGYFAHWLEARPWLSVTPRPTRVTY